MRFILTKLAGIGLAVATILVATKFSAAVFTGTQGPSATVWVTAGISVGLLWGWGLWMVPAVLVGVTWAALAASPPATATVLGVGATAQALLIVWLLRRRPGVLPPESPHDIPVVLVVMAVGSSVSVLGGGLASGVINVRGPGGWLDVWQWWIGDAVGVLLVAPVVVLLANRWNGVDGVDGRGWLASSLVAGITLFEVGRIPEFPANPGVWVASGGGALGLFLMLGLLRALHSTQRRVEASEARYRGLFERSAVQVLLIGPDGEFLMVNQGAAENMGGFPRIFSERRSSMSFPRLRLQAGWRSTEPSVRVTGNARLNGRMSCRAEGKRRSL